jgi:4-carboxymuconolactone decarboxylase
MTSGTDGPGGPRRVGEAVRRQVLGDAHVDAAFGNADDFTHDFQEFLTTYAWGEIWGRPGLDRRTRSVITLSVLATLRAETELAMHVRAARRNGLSPGEIKEVLLQVAIYAGVPAANTAFAVAQRVLREEATGDAARPGDPTPPGDAT